MSTWNYNGLQLQAIARYQSVLACAARKEQERYFALASSIRLSAARSHIRLTKNLALREHRQIQHKQNQRDAA